MLRKIHDPFEYIDYRLLLNNDFLARTSCNHGYSMRAYARDLSLSPSFVSDLLHGKRELSQQTSRDVFAKLGFQLEELDYLEDLVRLKQNNDPIEHQNILQAVHRRHKAATRMDDANKDLIMKSVDHFLMHGLVGGESQRRRIVDLAARVGIPIERSYEIIGEMVTGGYFRESGDEIFIEHLNLYIPNHSRILDIQRDFVNRMIDLTIASGGNRMPEHMGHYLALGLDQTTFPLAAEAYKHFLNTLNRLSNQTPVAERYAFFSSTFYSFLADRVDSFCRVD